MAANAKALLSVAELNLINMNKEQILKRLAMNIVNQLFDLADVPVKKRQAVNDEADAFVLRLLQQCNVSGSLPPMTEQELFEIYKAGMDNIDADGCSIDNPTEDFKETLDGILSRRQ